MFANITCAIEPQKCLNLFIISDTTNAAHIHADRFVFDKLVCHDSV